VPKAVLRYRKKFHLLSGLHRIAYLCTEMPQPNFQLGRSNVNRTLRKVLARLQIGDDMKKTRTTNSVMRLLQTESVIQS
jgi:hypothetical protein